MAQRPRAFPKMRFYPVAIIAFIAVALVVPLVIAVIIAGNTPEESRIQPSNSYVVALHALRVDNQTIKIINLGGEGKPLLDKEQPFLIMINGYNATDRNALEAHNLSMAIYPEAGLGYASGSSVTYSGNYVSANNSVHVLVFGIYRGGVRQNMLNVTID